MFTGTHWPNLSLAAYPENTDKALHLTGYAGFGFLLALWFSVRAGKSGVAAARTGFAAAHEIPLDSRSDCRVFDFRRGQPTTLWPNV